MEKLIDKSKPYIAMISLQFGYAGMNVITKISLNRGMNHFVLVVYSHTTATIVLALAPFAFFIERVVARIPMWLLLGLLKMVVARVVVAPFVQ